jgi:hypothetical protein
MFRCTLYLATAAVFASLLAGCAFNFMGEQRASWRNEAEAACMTRHDFASSPYIVAAKEVDGRGACGIAHPLQVAAFAEGAVAVGPSAMLGCPLVDAVESWLRDAVEPAAVAWYGEPVVGLRQISDYSCRSRNNIHGESLSEHAFGNALDIAAFILRDGREVTVKSGWRGGPRERGFLREVEATACRHFTTVLGPGAPYHGDHFHVDLARPGSGQYAHYCNPTPQVMPPARAPYTPARIAGAGAGAAPPAGAPWPAPPASAVAVSKANRPLSYAKAD